MVSQQFLYLLLLLMGTIFVPVVYSLTCYKGFRLVRGQSFGTETEECEHETAHCYNMTADAAFVLKIMKAGCSTYRCMKISRNLPSLYDLRKTLPQFNVFSYQRTHAEVRLSKKITHHNDKDSLLLLYQLDNETSKKT
ncbi:unnamed protein product [Acanthocheilonema viteae]|uniref:Uncharacterized protein n=1 Tax=Acanthocheilonema viteae TaxID=6277 RepID=A0A498SEX3_ACAVI|nr:unnamed protein product [Acanthocheilonema viteae]